MINKETYQKIKVATVTGRYVTNDSVFNFLSTLDTSFKVETIGYSAQERPIKSVTIGQGPKRIFMWSQMHGNESTTTKAVLDLLNYLSEYGTDTNQLLDNCTLKIIPILSPDGAQAYTRINANAVDLNRDAQHLTQPESIVLHETFKAFKPHFAFNLHGQRTIYNVGTTNKPATVSFLSPSVDESRRLNECRKTAMQIIVAMNKELQKTIPGGVGRYDDGFNLNCVGDTFQSLNCPTVLFEAGHFPNDYEREKVRVFIFQALITAIVTISNQGISNYNFEDYFEIPENGKQFFDILIKNIYLFKPEFKREDAVGILYVENLIDGKIVFKPKIEKIGDLSNYYGHKTFNCSLASELAELKNYLEHNAFLNNNL